jgi:drug/metabolite transporter (DMT)-like permease
MDEAPAFTRRYAIGVALVVISTIALSIAPTGARLAYDAGSNTLTVVALRGLIAMVLLAVCLLALGASFRSNPIAIGYSAVAGAFYALMLYGYLGSVEYIPVSLAILIYFIHPILIVGIAAVRSSTRIGWQKMLLSLLVFVGLGIAIGPEASTLDPRGIALALLAAGGICGMILFNARAQAGMSNTLTNFYMTAVTGGIFGVITTIAGGWVFPQTALGWAGVAMTGLGVVIGLLAFFAAFQFIGPVRTTMISNVEPIIGILFAVAVLGETLQLQQWFGALLVVAGLICFEIRKSRLATTEAS